MEAAQKTNEPQVSHIVYEYSINGAVPVIPSRANRTANLFYA